MDNFYDNYKILRNSKLCEIQAPYSNKKIKEEFLSKIRIDEFIYNYCLSIEEKEMIDNRPKNLSRRRNK